jgi:CheY-like chemotaxis protein
MGGREQLEQLCRILWQNAVEAMPQGGTLRWSTGLGRPADVGPGNGRGDPFIVLKVSDSGVGMDPETRSRMFDPFFTTKQGKLRGLDLTVAYEIVCDHFGSVEVTTGPDEGTSISVYLPAQLNPPDPQAEGQGSAEVQRSKQLLVVDDEELILQMLHEFLEGEGYDVTGVVTGEEALAICQDPNVNIDVVILDMSLPGITGEETFKHLMELQRGIKVIISTGNPHQQAVHDVMGQGAHGMLSKPFQLDHLAKVVKQLLS